MYMYILNKIMSNNKSLIVFLWWSLWASRYSVMSQDQCNFGNNVIYNRGDPLLDIQFQSTCGSTSDYTCYCNPSLSPPLECRFCRFETINAATFDCAVNGESITFTRDDDGMDYTCTCIVPDPFDAPYVECDGDIDPPNPVPLQTCAISVNGVIRTFQPGDVVPTPENQCGTNFPCFCNPNYEGQIECPYCTVPILNDEVFCLRDGETKALVNNENRNVICNCNVPEPFDDPVTTCRFSVKPSPVPPPPPTPTGCYLPSRTDNTMFEFVPNGESFGDLFPIPCGSTEDWPCFCNTELSNGIYCPYCSFAKADGSLVCARDQETIPFQDLGVTKQCSCNFNGSLSNPTRICVNDDNSQPTESPPAGCPFPSPSGGSVTIAAGESYGDLVVGPCGNSMEFPTFCNPLVTGQMEYPYCIFEDLSGTIICAKINEEVMFTDLAGDDQTCSCVASNSALGPTSTCTPSTTSVSNKPTMEPTMAPIKSLAPSTMSNGTNPTLPPGEPRSGGVSKQILLLFNKSYVLSWLLLFVAAVAGPIELIL